MEIKVTLTPTDEEAISPDSPAVEKLWDKLVPPENRLELFKDCIRDAIEVFMMQEGIPPEFKITVSIQSDVLIPEQRDD